MHLQILEQLPGKYEALVSVQYLHIHNRSPVKGPASTNFRIKAHRPHRLFTHLAATRTVTLDDHTFTLPTSCGPPAAACRKKELALTHLKCRSGRCSYGDRTGAHPSSTQSTRSGVTLPALPCLTLPRSDLASEHAMRRPLILQGGELPIPSRSSRPYYTLPVESPRSFPDVLLPTDAHSIHS